MQNISVKKLKQSDLKRKPNKTLNKTKAYQRGQDQRHQSHHYYRHHHPQRLIETQLVIKQ